jgi:hypothetical protein
LEKTTTRSSKEVSQELIDRYNFRIFMEDIYTVRVADKGTLEIYVFGVLGVNLPLRDG